MRAVAGLPMPASGPWRGRVIGSGIGSPPGRLVIALLLGGSGFLKAPPQMAHQVRRAGAVEEAPEILLVLRVGFGIHRDGGIGHHFL